MILVPDRPKIVRGQLPEVNVSVPRRELSEVHPLLFARIPEFLHECGRRGLPVFVAEAFRHPNRQLWLYAHGRPDWSRQLPEAWLKLPRSDGRPGPIEAPPIVTKAKPGQSYHNLEIHGWALSAAIDVAVWDEDQPPWKKTLEWDASDREWKVVHKAAAKVGLQTLSFEAPHVQLPVQLQQLAEGRWWPPRFREPWTSGVW